MEWPAGVATSVLVTYMSAHEQSNIPVTMARNDFIRLFGKLPSHPMTGEKANRRVVMQLLCRRKLKSPKLANVRHRRKSNVWPEAHGRLSARWLRLWFRIAAGAGQQHAHDDVSRQRTGYREKKGADKGRPNKF